MIRDGPGVMGLEGGIGDELRVTKVSRDPCLSLLGWDSVFRGMVVVNNRAGALV